MNRSDIVNLIDTQMPQLSSDQVRKGVDMIFESMSQALANKDRIEVRGFGSFSVRERQARQARNPKTGDKVQVGSYFRPHFKPGKELRARVNA
ncbi:HU family DNA-binding protein [Vibrio owensii]|uniref:HU family DNA-binding protein n=1 Tax=Vibrio harveyi group TaxID=717610 RepID=UPI003CC67754